MILMFWILHLIRDSFSLFLGFFNQRLFFLRLLLNRLDISLFFFIWIRSYLFWRKPFCLLRLWNFFIAGFHFSIWGQNVDFFSWWFAFFLLLSHLSFLFFILTWIQLVLDFFFRLKILFSFSSRWFFFQFRLFFFIFHYSSLLNRVLGIFLILLAFANPLTRWGVLLLILLCFHLSVFLIFLLFHIGPFLFLA